MALIQMIFNANLCSQNLSYISKQVTSLFTL